jgi:L-amino acid N-acyltransferase YncA
MTAIVRPSEDRDLPDITAIYSHAVLNGTASFEIDPPDEAEMARRRRELLAAGYPYLVAEADDRIVGYAYASSYRPRPAYRFTVEDSIYVAPEVQGRGVGRALLSSLIAHCERQGFRQMIGVIGDSSSTGSIALHRALGFLNAGVVRDVGYKHGRWLDQVIMQRRLGSAAEGVPAMESDARA